MKDPTHLNHKSDATIGQTQPPGLDSSGVQHHAQPRHAPDKKNRSVKLWAIVLIVAIVLGVAGWQRVALRTEKADHDSEKAAPPTDVVVVNDQQLKEISTDVVQEHFVTVDRKATGKVGFNEDRLTPVFTPYSGRIIELLANKGDNVKVGQPLVVLESPDYIAAQNDLASARSDVAKAKIGLNSAQISAERARLLHDQEAISTKDLQQAEADLARARDELRRAEATLAAVENRVSLFGKDPQEIASLEEHVDRRVNVRVIAATNKNLHEQVRDGQFREDLFYRLNVVPLALPTLRERKEDIPQLVDYFLMRFHAEGKRLVRVSREALDALQKYDFPGNVRELENILERAIVLSDGQTITPRELHLSDAGAPASAIETSNSSFKTAASQAREDAERTLLKKTLEQTGWNRVRAARILGIDYKTLRRKIRKYNLSHREAGL